MKNSFFTYILRCSDNSLYTGYTDNLERRLEVHNSGKWAKYTRWRIPVVLEYFEEFSHKSEAMKREAEIKKLSKQQKELLLQKIAIK